MTTALNLLIKETEFSPVSTGLRKLDYKLKGRKGVLPGNLYDVTSVMGIHGTGYYDIVMSIINNYVKQKSGDVLFVSGINKIPWFKIKVADRSRVKIVQAESLVDIIALFQEGEYLKNFGMVVIEPFGYFYQVKMNELNTGKKDTLVRYEQAINSLFHMMLHTCHNNNSIVITMGQMEIYSQKVHTSMEETFFKENILVPIISLKSPLSKYYTNRILLFRDWVIDNDEKFSMESIKQIKYGNIECLPNFICIDPRNLDEKPTGWFSVDNKFRLLDLEQFSKDPGDELDVSFDLVTEIPESQP